jgi:periplasmic copper chaperone A
MFGDEKLLRPAHRKLRAINRRAACGIKALPGRLKIAAECFNVQARSVIFLQTYGGDPMRRMWMGIAGGLIFTAFSAGAQEYRLGSLTAEHAWSRPTSGPNKLGAAYLILKNAGQEADTLQSASSPDAEKVEIHEHTQDASGIMRMRPVEGGLKVPAGGAVEFKPGGYHLMLFGLKHNLEEGQQLPLKLHFAHAGDLDVEVKVEKRPSAPAGMHEHKG